MPRAQKNTRIEGYSSVCCPYCKADNGTVQSNFASIIAPCCACARMMKIEVVNAYVVTKIRTPDDEVDKSRERIMRVLSEPNTTMGTHDIDPEPPAPVKEQMERNQQAMQPKRALPLTGVNAPGQEDHTFAESRPMQPTEDDPVERIKRRSRAAIGGGEG